MHLIRPFSHKPIECLLLLLWFLLCILSHTHYMYIQSYRSTHRSQTCRASSSFQTNKNLTKILSQGESFYEWYEKCFCFLKEGFVYPIDTWHSVRCLILVILRVFYLLSFFLTENCTPTQKHGRTLSQNSLFHFFNLCVSLSPSLCR